MNLKVFKNKILVDFDILSEFAKAVEKATKDTKFIYIAYDGKELTLFSEESHVGALVISKTVVAPTEKGQMKPFSAGLDAAPFLALMKKLYKGFITIKLGKKSKIILEEDNIKVSFAIVSPKSYFKIPEGVNLPGDAKDWVIQSLIDCLASVEEAAKTASGPFNGILFDTSAGVSRICKFSNVSLYLASNQAFFGQDYRVVIPDNIAKLAKAFQKDISDLILTENSVGLSLKQGTKVYNAQPADTYLVSYINGLNLAEGLNMIPQGSEHYLFDTNHLLNAVDLVATTLGDDESWVKMAIVGTANDDSNMVWEVSGKSFKGLEVKEEVLSSRGIITEPFAVNKKRMLRSLSTFDQEVYAYDLSTSALALASSTGAKVALLIKANI